jgi:hypothetical protein
MVPFTKHTEYIRNIRQENFETNIWANQREWAVGCRYNRELYELYKGTDIVDFENAMGRACDKDARREDTRKIMKGRLEGVRPIGRPRKRWMDGDRREGITEDGELEGGGAG